MKILIADDEKMARLSLHSMLEELYPGAHEYFYAANGKEAVERAGTNRPDLVFMDIRMPVMDGLESMRHIREFAPETAVVVLSGYSDFEYARTAVSLDAAEYLLKPVGLEQLRETTDKALYAVYRQRAMLFSDTVSKVFLGNENGLSFPKNANEVFRLFLVFEDLAPDCSDPASRFANWAKTTDFGARTLLYSFYLPSGRLCCVSVTDEPMTENARFREQIQAFNSSSMGRATVLYAEAENLKKLRGLLPELEELSDLRYVGIVSGFCDTAHLPKEKCTKQAYRFSGALRKFIEAAQSENRAEIGKWLSTFNETPEFAAAFKALSKPMLQDFLSGILGGPVDTSDYRAFIESIELNGRKGLQGLSSEGVDLVEAAKAYVREHYMDNFSIASLSEYLSITPAYLSRVFHQRTGEKLIDYITKQRIREAERILRENPNITVKKLAEMVGYASAKHFNSMFIKYTGVSPAEYGKAGK